MMYSVQMRMNNPGPAKYLIQSVDKSDFMEAFQTANEMVETCDADHFVEIVDADSGDKVAVFRSVN